MTRLKLIRAATAVAVSFAFSAAPRRAAAAPSVFTYQGQIQQGGVPVTGNCDAQFRLYAVDSGGTEVAPAVAVSGLSVANGLFTAPLGFGTAPFDGADRFLEVAVRCPSGSGSYTTLAPRQPITAAPYAFYAGTVNWNGISGMPAGFQDAADADTLGGLSCAAGQIPKWTGAWGCGADQDTTYTPGTGLTLSAGQFSIDASVIQRRVTGSCGAGYAISQINNDGTVACESTGPLGDITAVTAGSGLTGGGTSGDVSVGANFTTAGGSNGSDATVARGDHNHFGQVWGGADSSGIVVQRTNTGGGYAVKGVDGPGAGFSLGSSAGVWGDSQVHYGVVGTSNSSLGVLGYSATNSGVAGWSTTGEGVLGQSDDGTGIYGTHIGSGGTLPGVRGRTYSTAPNADGVVGEVYSSSAGALSAGVRGINNSTILDVTYGVFGSSNSIGVRGKQGGGTGAVPSTGAGVWGDSHDSMGVAGFSDAQEGVYGMHVGNTEYPGVGGYTYSTDGGTASNPGAKGVMGRVSSASPGPYSAGVYGEIAEAASANGIGVYGHHWGTGWGVLARSNAGVPLAAMGSSESDIEFYVSNSGEVYADGAFHPGGADFAEVLPAAGEPQPGDVLAIDEEGRLVQSSHAGQRTVAGVYSTQPGLVGGDDETSDRTGKALLAVAGVVPVRATVENGPIRPGDMLIASSTPAHAMAAGPNPEAGTVIGKALAGLPDGSGTIRMLVMLR